MDRQWAFHAAATPVPSQNTYKVYPFLTGVTVTLDAMLVSAIQVSIDSPFEEGIVMLSEDDGGASPFNTGNLIKVKIGYGEMNLWTPWYYGMLSEGGDGLSIGPEGVSGTVSAHMNNWQSGYVAENAGATSDTAKAFLQKIADGMGMTMEIGPMALTVLAQVDAVRNNQPWASFAKTNMEVLQSVCASRGLICTPTFQDDGKPDVLKIFSNAEVSRGDAMAGKKRNMYVMRGAFSPQSQQYPILSWGPDPSLASWLGSTVRSSNAGIGMRGLNKMTGSVVQLDVNPYDSEEPIVGKATRKAKAQDRSYKGKKLDSAVSNLVKFIGPGGGLLTPEIYSVPVSVVDDGQAAADMKQQGVSKMTSGNQAQMATLKSLGVPDQNVLELIEVRGLSPRYDGPYKVMGATHTFAPGSYEMDLKVVRAGTMGSDEPEQKGTVGGQVPPA
jgi:hypothetical protein